ncbi:MAG: hypothetical protein E6R03_10350 [Hyphomicrobiaceae bacterium]|nr:MAG: hypothetical protein E6R03_10350 [Hyphomicrobiaceae bacterium]
MKTPHLIFFVGWFSGMITANVIIAVAGASLGERVRAVERGDGKFVVQTQYGWGGRWRDDFIHQDFKTMDEAVREVEARRAKSTVRRVAP